MDKMLGLLRVGVCITIFNNRDSPKDKFYFRCGKYGSIGK